MSTKPALSDDPLARYRALRNPWTFIENATFTIDEVDARTPVKAAPSDRAYLKSLTMLWAREPLLAVFKSRRMWLSWLFIALYLHDTFTHLHRRTFFVSKKQEDADDLVGRALSIYENIPRNVFPAEFLPKARRKENFLIFDELGSSIQAVASGPDQLRQFTASGIFMDEFGFWQNERDTYTASKPTITGGGRVTIVSTPPPQFGTSPTFFKQLVFDLVDR